MRHRVCDWPHCKTVLSRFNAGPRCWTHQGDLTQELTKAQVDQLTHRYPVMSDEFVRNAPGTYLFTPSERANYKRGAW